MNIHTWCFRASSVTSPTSATLSVRHNTALLTHDVHKMSTRSSLFAVILIFIRSISYYFLLLLFISISMHTHTHTHSLSLSLSYSRFFVSSHLMSSSVPLSRYASSSPMRTAETCREREREMNGE